MTDSHPLVSIVVPAYNATGTLAECLAACKAQHYPNVDVLVVDDGSTDGTAELSEGLGVRCVRQANAGPAAARNRGAAESRGAFIAYTDSDCVPEPGWIDALMAAMESGVGAVGGTYTIANPQSLLARIVHYEIEARHKDLAGEVDFLGSFNVVIRRDAFDQAAGFDESFSEASGEDNDLSYRLHDLHWKLIFTRWARVAHYHPEGLWGYLRTQARHGYWRVKLYRKHPGRSGGDRYAGLPDLVRPPLLMVAVGLVALGGSLAIGGLKEAAGVTLVMGALAVALYGALAFLQALRVMYSTRSIAMAAYGPLLIVRDGARVAGLLRGVIERG